MIAFGLLALVAVSGVISASVPFHFLSDEYIDHINSLQTTWKAGRNFPKDMPLSNIKRRMGVIRGEKSKNLKTVRHVRVEGETIPDTFDARENWPDCKSIGLIRDQSDCGSCWAVAAAAAMSDRICILSKGKDQSLVSDEDLNSCCKSCGDCDGGIPYAAWEYWQQTGIVTGGVYQQTSYDFLGVHAIKLIGWGEENNVPYWLVANSWNEDWGDKGTFKIRRGTNECGIEEEPIAGLPLL
ncbi:unnamed protein product [Phaedon cochleariae]|uniref:Peptidase C1A papain C-terminal domain-containing protein n=1 Tax=Phaedon cochleariae TaxID=80249 RepID=A0A9N9SJN7_PHACE|nr:unnamed protein product [Phaedon cochleariae]